ncbi:MAG: MFS transporter [Promethearchaeota archaeon]
MIDDEPITPLEPFIPDAGSRPGRLGLSPNLWRLAAVIAIAQFATAVWKWEFSIFLEGFLAPWQIGLVFSIATLTGLIGSIASGYIADFIGRKWTISLGFLPIVIGLFTMSFFPIWPFVAVQYGLVWFGMSTARLMSRAIPADEIAAGDGRNPARRLMMVMMPLWFVDALGPMVGAFLLSSGYQAGNLHFIGAVCAIITFFSSVLLLKESLGTEVIRKARAGPKISLRRFGRSFWLLALGMIGFVFSWSSSIPYVGNISVGPWGVDTVTYGLTWSLFSITSALFMYPGSLLADRNLKITLFAGVLGNALIFLWFSQGSGALMLYIINFAWAIPFVLWTGSVKSIIVLVVSEEVKGRALGTYDLLMGFVSMAGQFFGGSLWGLSGSLRVVYGVAGLIALVTSVFVFVLLRSIHIPNNTRHVESSVDI